MREAVEQFLRDLEQEASEEVAMAVSCVLAAKGQTGEEAELTLLPVSSRQGAMAAGVFRALPKDGRPRVIAVRPQVGEPTRLGRTRRPRRR